MILRVIYESPDGTPFPVEWASAELARDEWRWDQVHNPTPLTPLAQDLIALKRRGMYRGGVQTGRPFNEERMYANGYGFSRSLAEDPASAEVSRTVAALDSRSRIDRLLELWESSYKPETEALTRSLRTWASPGDSLFDLLERFNEIEAAWCRLGELHTLSTGLAAVAMREFEAFCRDAFGEDGSRIAVESVAGMPNMSVASAEALWELSRHALESHFVADILRKCDPDRPLSGLGSLDSAKEGVAFRSLFDQFLETWGQRNESYYEIAYPTWREDPGFVLTTLRAYMDAPAEQSPTVLHLRAVKTREARTKEAMTRLRGSGNADAFLTGQRRAQQHTVLMEDHNYYIDQRAYTTLRTPFLAIGDRLAAEGSLDHARDVFYLHTGEIKDRADYPAGGRPRYQALVEKRRADREAWMHVLPPLTIGGDAREIPVKGTARPASPVAKRSARKSSRPTAIQGLAASAGRFMGTARLILSLDDAGRLSPGDVLVTYATAPPWTPLFAIAGAVVTDAGGPLAHCALVAREYGIPAVVGTGTATAVIKDGMVVTVDGTTGLVTIEE